MPALATMTANVLSERSGVDIDTINAYERLGMIPKHRRSPGGFQLYSSEAVSRLIFIRRATELGFSLGAIRELLTLTKPGTCREVYQIAERHLADIRRRRSDLERMENALAPLVSACPREGSLSACPLLTTLSQPE
jgi:MerR family transcriptional regulator, mercuric resistance operon regulatory protein